MIIDTETKRKLREMNATDLLDAFERLDEQTTMPLSHAEVIRLAVDSAPLDSTAICAEQAQEAERATMGRGCACRYRQ